MLLPGSVFFSAYGQAWTVFTTVNSPIPSDIVWCVTVDRSSNTKWVGTDWGLSRFDGSNWTVFNTTNSGLPDNSVRSLAVDENGAVWVGTLGGGLVKYDGISWTLYNNTNSGIPDNFVKAIAFDTAGALWVGTPGGLGKYDWNSWSVWDQSNSPIWSHHILCLKIGSDNIKRIGTLNGGLLYWNDTTFSEYNYWDGNFPENTVTSIDMDSAGKPWVTMGSSGLNVHLGGPAWNWMSMATSSIPSDVLNHIHIDNDQHKYLCSQNKGFISYVNNTWTNYDSTNSGFPDTWATQSVKDTAGILWIGTWARGLVRLDESQLNNVVDYEKEYIILKPNPVPDHFSITLEKPFSGEWLILDPLGAVVGRWPVADRQHQFNFDISPLASGTYLLCGRDTQDRKYFRRIIKI